MKHLSTFVLFFLFLGIISCKKEGDEAVKLAQAKEAIKGEWTFSLYRKQFLDASKKPVSETISPTSRISKVSFEHTTAVFVYNDGTPNESHTYEITNSSGELYLSLFYKGNSRGTYKLLPIKKNFLSWSDDRRESYYPIDNNSGSNIGYIRSIFEFKK